MKKVLVNYGGIVLFYLIMIFGVLLLCTGNSTSSSKNSSFGISSAYKN